MSVFAVSDLHGNGVLWDNIKAFLKPEDTLYFIGDAADRGPDGWRILKEALNHPQVIYIAGNHDVMLADRIARPNSYDAVGLHWQNGGDPTWQAVEQDNPEVVKEIMLKIRRLPRWVEYVNESGATIFMSHSGCTNKSSDEDLIWDRHEFFTDHRVEGIDLVVHGHTTVPHLIKEFDRANQWADKIRYPVPSGEEIEPGAFWYADNYRVDIDCCTILTDITVLLNLDTFDEEIFQA